MSEELPLEFIRDTLIKIAVVVLIIALFTFILYTKL